MNDKEGDRVAEKDSSLNDTESHIASNKHDEGNRYEIGILLL